MKKTNTGLVVLIMLFLIAVICLALWLVLDKDSDVPSNDLYQNGGQENNDSAKSDTMNLTSLVDLKKCLDSNV